MTLFLKMEAVIILGKSILVGRSCRLDKIVLFDFFENQKIRCPPFGERFENFDRATISSCFILGRNA